MKYIILSTLISVGFSIRHPLSMKVSSNFNNALQNRYKLQETTYNSLLQRIENKEVSKLYFTLDNNVIISENTEQDPDDDIYKEYSITKITPQLTDSLVDLSVKHDVEPIFGQTVQPSQPQQIASEILGTINFLFVPFIVLTILINVIRGALMSMPRSMGAGRGRGPGGLPFPCPAN